MNRIPDFIEIKRSNNLLAVLGEGDYLTVFFTFDDLILQFTYLPPPNHPMGSLMVYHSKKEAIEEIEENLQKNGWILKDSNY